jgi:hypothetical protein
MKSPKATTIIETTAGYDRPEQALHAIEREKAEYPKEDFGTVCEVRQDRINPRIRSKVTPPSYERIIITVRRLAYPVSPGESSPDLSDR